MRLRTLTLTVLGAGATIAAALMLWVGTASAAATHPYLSDITEVPASTKVAVTGPLSVPSGLAFTAGDLWVASAGRGHAAPDIDEFASPSGSFLGQITYERFDSYTTSVAVSRSSGEVYLADSGPVLVYVFDASGKYEATWNGADTPSTSFGYGYDSVAVDNSTDPSDPDQGYVYVTDSADQVVDVFKPGAGGVQTYEAELTGPPKSSFGEPNGIAVDEATGDVYVIDLGSQVVDVFKPEAGGKYEYLSQLTGPPWTKFERIGGVAIDPVSGAVYVSDWGAKAVYQFESDGIYAGQFGSTPSGPLERPRGIAVGPEEDVYLADSEQNVVDVFGPQVVVPDVSTGAASEVERATATVAGTVNPDKTMAKYYFEYWESGAAANTTPAEEAEGEATLPILAKLTGLKTSTTYEYRLVAENSNGKNEEATKSFTTPTAIENLKTLAPTGLAVTEQTFNGELTPNGYPTTCWFEYEGGNTPATKTAKQSVGEEAKVVKFSQTVHGLEPNVSYSNHIACENTFGTSYGSGLSGQTLTAAPEVSSESTSNISRQRAVLHAIVNPENESTHYYFEYGTSTEYGYDTAELEVSTSQFGERAVQGAATELETNKQYHYRLVAKNGTGVTRGPDATFTSGSPVPPTVTTGGASAISASGATVEGIVSTSGLVTSYGFEVSTDPDAFGPPTGLGSVGAGFDEAPASLVLKGLQAKTTYYYKIVGTNPDGTSEGKTEQFTTAEYPPDEIGVEVLPILTEPFTAWPVVSEPLYLKEAPASKTKPKPGACKKGLTKHKGRCVKTGKKGKGHGAMNKAKRKT